MSVLLIVATVGTSLAVACRNDSATSAIAGSGSSAMSPPGNASAADVPAPLPIASEPLTQRHEFTDEVSVQLRLKASGRSRDVVNIPDASRMAVVRFTIQPGVRFPWHSHPGLVLVAVTKGDLVFVYGDDCVQRRYPTGTAFVDPGFGNVHYAFNPTAGELEIVATFLGVPEAPAALTNPVSPTESAALDAKCGVAAATAEHNGH
jgi:quercetin dioxygenase-like cupin family protein